MTIKPAQVVKTDEFKIYTIAFTSTLEILASSTMVIVKPSKFG